MAEDWPQWRGPSQSGLTSELSGWDGTTWKIQKKWQVNVGSGMGASPILVDGKVYVMGWADEGDQLQCLDAASGNVLWKQQYKARQDGRFRKGESAEGPTCTPTFDPRTRHLYTLGNDGDLYCWDAAKQGKPVWNLNLYDSFKVPARRSSAQTDPGRDYGYCGNVLLHQDWIIVEVGDKASGNIFAFDKKSGKVLWRSQDKNRAGHNCGPVMMQIDGRPCVVSFTLEGLRVMRADKDHEGQDIAWYPWVMPFNVNCPTPCVVGDTVILTGTDDYRSGKKTTFLKIGPKGIEKTWEGERQAYVCSPVAHQGYVYLFDNKLYCLELATGKLAWEGGKDLGGVAGSVLVSGDDKAILWNRNKLVLIESAKNSPKAYKELARIDNAIAGSQADCYPHLALAGGYLLVKNKAGDLACYKVQQAALGGR